MKYLCLSNKILRKSESIKSQPSLAKKLGSDQLKDVLPKYNKSLNAECLTLSTDTEDIASASIYIVTYESTVYSGAMQEDCVPILEHHSDLKYNQDFFCGYSPEYLTLSLSSMKRMGGCKI